MSGLAKILKHGVSFGGGSGTFTQNPFWNADDRAARFSRSAPVSSEERIESSFEDYVQKAYKANGIVFACVTARQLPFSEALFRYQEMNTDDGTPGPLSYGAGLDVLDKPGTLLSRMEQDGSIAGNSYWTPVNGTLRRMRPDWVTIVTGIRGDVDGSPFALDAEILSYIYHPTTRDKRGNRPDAVILTPKMVAHYAPVPDPEAQWRGMSWLTPVLNEIQGDQAITKHKHKFFQNGAMSNMVVTYDASVSPELFNESVRLFNDAHAGSDHAYKTIHLGGGSDAKMAGADLKSLDFKAVQGAGETRIAAAAGVGSIIGRLSEGMQGSSLNAGNYNSAKRQYADMTLRPLWRTAAECLEKFTNPPPGSRLWYADKHIDFLQEDAKDAASIFSVVGSTIRALTDGGYTPESAVLATANQNASLLVHSGKLSVQLTDPEAVITSESSPRELAEMIQKIYLGVGTVLSSDEARELLNRAGASLNGGAPTNGETA